jgi:hypothetical protein
MDFDDNDLVNEQLKPAHISIKSDFKISLRGRRVHNMKLRATTSISKISHYLMQYKSKISNTV